MDFGMMNRPVSNCQDRAEITDLVHRYALYVRQGHGAACGNLFTQDAIYDICEVAASSPRNLPTHRNRIEGRPAIAEYIAQAGSGSVRICPLIHNILVEIEGDTATGTAMLESRTWPAGHEFIGEYQDTFRREEVRWLFASRTFTLYLNDTASAEEQAA
jgi:hypothetical protein